MAFTWYIARVDLSGFDETVAATLVLRLNLLRFLERPYATQDLPAILSPGLPQDDCCGPPKVTKLHRHCRAVCGLYGKFYDGFLSGDPV